MIRTSQRKAKSILYNVHLASKFGHQTESFRCVSNTTGARSTFRHLREAYSHATIPSSSSTRHRITSCHQYKETVTKLSCLHSHSISQSRQICDDAFTSLNNSRTASTLKPDANCEGIPTIKHPIFGVVSPLPANISLSRAAPNFQKRYLDGYGSRMISTSEKSASSKVNKSGTDGKDNASINPLYVALGGGIVVSGALLSQTTFIDQMKQSNSIYSFFETDIEDAMFREMKKIQEDLSGPLHNLLDENGMNEDRKAVNKKAGILADILSSDALKNAIATLLSKVIESEPFQNSCHVLVKNLWQDLVKDPETTAEVIQLLNTAIKDERIKDSFKQLVITILRDKEVYEELTSLVVRLGEEQEVLDATKDLLTESAHKAMSDPEILDHSMEFATDVVGDDVVQRTSGEALRNTVTYAVRPSLSTILSVFGLSLLFISASALGNARSSAQEGKEIDAAASTVFKQLGESIFDFVFQIVSLPGQIISTIGSTAIDTVQLPVKLVAAISELCSKVGSSFTHQALKITGKVVSLPKCAIKGLSSAMFSASGALKDMILYTMSPFLSFYGYLIYKGTENWKFICSIVSTISRSLSRIKPSPILIDQSVSSITGALSGISSVVSYIWNGISWSSFKLYDIGSKVHQSCTWLVQFIIASWSSMKNK